MENGCFETERFGVSRGVAAMFSAVGLFQHQKTAGRRLSA